MDGEEKKKRKTYGEKDCVTAVAISAGAGIVAGFFYESGQTFGKWIQAEIVALFISAFVVAVIVAIPMVAIKQYNDDSRTVNLFTLIVACLIANLVFLYASWSIRRVEISDENARMEEQYQAAYDDGYRAAKEELQEYYEDTYYAFDEMDEAANEGYLIGYEHGVEDTKDNAFNDGYNEGYSDGTRIAFSAINDLGISDLSGDEILAAWDEYYDEMIEIYGMPGPTIDGEDKRLVVAPDGTLHVEGCKALWGLDINSFVYFDLIEDGTGAGYALVCDQCHPLDDQFASWNNIGGNE